MSKPPFRLHHVPYSRSMRVLWLIEEIGLEEKFGQPLEIIRYDIGSEDMRSDSLRKISPASRIPALEVSNEEICESGAIVEYLVETYGGHLGPFLDEVERPQYLQWIHYAETMASLIEHLNLEMVFLRPPYKPNPVTVKITVARLRNALKGLELQMQGREWILNYAFSGADIMMGFNLFAAPYYVKFDQFPNLRAYKERIESLPSFQRVIEREGPQTFYKQDFYPVPEI